MNAPTNEGLRENFPAEAAKFLAHRYADMCQAAPRTDALKRAVARMDGACEMVSELGAGTTGTAVQYVIGAAYHTVGARPMGYGSLAEMHQWADRMAAAIVNGMKDVI